MNNKQTVSREEYRRLDNRVTCILQQRWPAHEIRQWVGMLKGKQRVVACAILRRRHPAPYCWFYQPSPPRCQARIRPESPPPHRAGALCRWPPCWPPPYRRRTHPRGHRSKRHHPLHQHREPPLDYPK